VGCTGDVAGGGHGTTLIYAYALTPALSISFQRYRYPADGSVTSLTSSYGALPLFTSAPSRLVLPCPDGEAFWIGLVTSPGAEQHHVRAVISTASGDRISTEDLPAPPLHGIPGLRRGDDSWWALARQPDLPTAPACRDIELLCTLSGQATSVIVNIVAPEEFQELSGSALPPLDEDDRYGGWRLP
jgi:hypothetical protein